MQWWIFVTSAHLPPSSPSRIAGLPQRAAPVQLLGHQAPHQQPKFLTTARGGKCRVPKVVFEVEVRVVDPHGPAELERHEVDGLPVPRHEAELCGDHLANLVIGRRRAVEDGTRGDVHVGDAVLQVEERGIEWTEPFHGHPPYAAAFAGRS